MGHAMATAGRGPRLLRKGSLLKVCLSSCGAKLVVVLCGATALSEVLGDGDEAMSHEYILDKQRHFPCTKHVLSV